MMDYTVAFLRAGVIFLVLLAGKNVYAEARSTGVQWGGAVPVQTFYDSNIYRASRSPIEDVGLRVSPNLSLGYNRPAWSTGWEGSFMRERYYGLLLDNPIQDRQGWDSKIRGKLQFSTGLALSGNYKYIDTEEPVYAELEQDRTPVRRFRHIAGTRIGQKLGAGRLDAVLDYSFVADRYDAVANRVLDANTHSVVLKALLKVFPKTAFFVRSEAGFRSYLNENRLVSEDYADVGLNFGMVGEWSPKLKGTMMLGGQIFIFSQSGIQVTPVIKLDSSYKPNGLSELILGYEHVLLDSTSTIYFNIDRLRTQLKRKLSRSWEFNAGVDASLLRYSPPFPRTDVALRSTVGFHVTPVPVPPLEIDVRYGYDYRDSNVETYRYISQTVGIDLLWKL